MKSQRLHGLDLARFLAFAGMVIVNFQVAMLAPSATASGLLEHATIVFEGKAAATFVALAGIGVALAHRRKASGGLHAAMLKRATFLLVLGLFNMIIFEADIIHYYAFYSVFGIWFLPLDKSALLIATIVIILAFPVLMIGFNYDAGWDWNTLSYSGVWTVSGFVTNLFFNGWHPVVPWLAFFTFGMFLAKLDIANKKTGRNLTAIGIAGIVVIPLLSQSITLFVTPVIGADVATLFATSPVPPGPLYMLNGLAASMLVIGLCLMLPNTLYQINVVKTLCQTGQQTLTLYFAHILIGMSILEALKLIETTNATVALWAAFGFVGASAVFVYFWRKKFERGPIEELMRRITG